MANKANKAQYPVSVEYTVRPGDTLSTIAKATKIPVSVLAQDNNIKNPDKIYTGQKLIFNYHPKESEAINSPEMNNIFPNHADQVYYNQEADGVIEFKYKEIARDGAQKHMNTEW